VLASNLVVSRCFLEENQSVDLIQQQVYSDLLREFQANIDNYVEIRITPDLGTDNMHYNATLKVIKKDQTFVNRATTTRDSFKVNGEHFTEEEIIEALKSKYPERII